MTVRLFIAKRFHDFLQAHCRSSETQPNANFVHGTAIQGGHLVEPPLARMSPMSMNRAGSIANESNLLTDSGRLSDMFPKARPSAGGSYACSSRLVVAVDDVIVRKQPIFDHRYLSLVHFSSSRILDLILIYVVEDTV